MTLADISTLDAIDNKTLAKLRDRLGAISLGPGKLESIVQAAGGTHPLLRRPILIARLRRVREPYAYAARALMFGDPIDGEGLGLAFGDLAGVVRESGLVRDEASGFVSPWSMTVINDRFVLTDDLSKGGDAVMGLGPLTVTLCAASVPRKKIGTVLDLGCGAGTVALVVARVADKVVATDINPRALKLARFNARLNGVFNIDLREGSLFEPVKGERFDLVASQPPFIPQSDEGKTGDFMQGGRRGDELVRALLADLPQHLTTKGRGVIIAEWGHAPSLEPPVDRVRAAIGEASLDVLMFQTTPVSCETHAIEYAAALHPELGEPFEAEAFARLGHCTKMGIETMVGTLCILKRVQGRPSRIDVQPCGPSSHLAPNARRIDKLLAARDVASALDSLLKAKLRMVDGVVLREEQVGPGAGVESTLSAVMPPKAMTEPIRITPLLLRLATSIHEASSVKAGIQAYSDRYETDEGPEILVPQIAHALLAGLLEVAE